MKKVIIAALILVLFNQVGNASPLHKPIKPTYTADSNSNHAKADLFVHVKLQKTGSQKHSGKKHHSKKHHSKKHKGTKKNK